MDDLLHVTSADAWDAAGSTGEYAIPPQPDGSPAPFIHLCRPEQLAGVVARFYPPPHDHLVVLTVRPAGLPILDEPAPDADGLFPHLYGPLPVSAVVAVRALAGALHDPAG
ncbi:DUF952 domain-containing protein [Paraconexibacter algicola]|uniref:DUF952 domain-containing protein n=1 Tax=Paraconexibacter algicola TaxID=2133960 RepID=A0A2T4UHZ5_9ACTN|nr:DUF952 domain-containing protein [Paraconexibacter algicola]PTL58853.1 DUF952 domain-containing protein [Paraconexibacter algicola]